MEDKIAQQIDIMPTLLDYLNFDEEYIAFGNDLLNDSSETFAFNTSGSTYHLFYKDYLLEMVDGRALSMYNYRKDRYLSTNLLGTQTELQHKMENKLRAIIQSYNTRLIDNDLTIHKADPVIHQSLSKNALSPEQ